MSRRANFNITDKIHAVLSASPEERMTSRDIAKKIIENFPEDCQLKRARASIEYTDDEFLQQIAREIGAHWRKAIIEHDNYRVIETRPKEFYFSESSEQDEAEATVKSTKETSSHTRKSFSEHDLYPRLGEFLWNELDCYAMRIDERRSKNNRGHKGNMWLYPDVVGMVDLSDGWSRNTTDLAKATRAELAHLYSFEVKLTINRSNVREVFFQTLSNSAWAHHSYLVAADINSNAVPELRMLCASHEIGLMQLDATDPANSQVMIPAQPKPAVDWTLLDRLAVENSDARAFLKSVRAFYLTGETSRRAWDLCPRE